MHIVDMTFFSVLSAVKLFYHYHYHFARQIKYGLIKFKKY